MIKDHTTWLKVTIALQFLTGLLHMLSFLSKPESNNDTEKQLFDLMSNYKFDMGSGFYRSMEELMNAFSLSFALLFFFTGILNLYLLKNKLPIKTLAGVVFINLITYLICFIAMILLTFLPPIICTGFIVLSLFISYLFIRKDALKQAS